MTSAIDATSQLMRLSDTVSLPEYGIAVGLVFVQGVGHRIGTVGPDGLRQMSAAEARRFARELLDTDAASVLKPVIDALEEQADKLDAFRLAIPAGNA